MRNVSNARLTNGVNTQMNNKARRGKKAAPNANRQAMMDTSSSFLNSVQIGSAPNSDIMCAWPQ